MTRIRSAVSAESGGAAFRAPSDFERTPYAVASLGTMSAMVTSRLLDYLRDQGECPPIGAEPPDAPPRLPVPRGTLDPKVPRSAHGSDLGPLRRVLSGPMGELNDNDPALWPDHLDGDRRSREFDERLQDWEESDQLLKEWLDQIDAETAEADVIDAAAWYQPVSFFGANAKIVLTSSGLGRLAAWISRNAGLRATDALELSEAFLRFHEHFHYCVEVHALRYHLETGTPRYRRYHFAVYEPATRPLLTDDLLEEALATAFAIRELEGHFRGHSEVVARKAAGLLRARLRKRPPGYRMADKYLDDADFELGCLRLSSSVTSGRLQLVPDRRRVAGNAIARPRPRYFIPETIMFHDDPKAPLAFRLSVDNRRLARLLRRHGYRPTDRGKGSHEVWSRKDGGPDITLPRRSEQSGHQVLKNTARALGMSVRQLQEAASTA